jgi:hypothetical protein
MGEHWYKPSGESFYEIEKANGSGLRPVNLRDARKLNLFPSVTGIMSELAAPALEMWKIKQAVTASRGMRKRKDETDDQFAMRANAKAKEKLKERAEQGTKTHDAMEQYFIGEPISSEYIVMVDNLLSALDMAEIGREEWAAEDSFARDGFGGKVDLHSPNVVLDFKTKERWDKPPVLYDNHFMQIAAYRYGLRLDNARGFIMFLNEETQAAHLVEVTADQLNKGWCMFNACRMLWQAKRGYYPTDENK